MKPTSEYECRRTLDLLQRYLPEPSGSQEEPVFVFGAGWFSGNWEIQQLLSEDCLFWGEPFGLCWPLDGLLQQLNAWVESNPAISEDDPSRDVDFERVHSGLLDEVAGLIQAQARMLDTLFAVPARKHGATRWGVSEVRFSGHHARFLKWLFPKAKFVFVVRDPFEAFETYFQSGETWLYTKGVGLTVSKFSEHWLSLALSFERAATDVSGILLRYEELDLPKTRRELCLYLDMPLCFDPSRTEYLRLLSDSCDKDATKDPNSTSADGDRGSSAQGLPEPNRTSGKRREVPLTHLREMRRILGDVASEHGYSIEIPTIASFAAPAPDPERAVEDWEDSMSVVSTHQSRQKCLVAVRVRGYIESICEQSLRVLESRGYRVDRVHGLSAIDVGRNLSVGSALSEGFDEIMWVDSRIAFNPDSIDQLRAFRLPIVGGAVPKTLVRGFECNFFDGTDEILFGEGGGLLEVNHTSCSFLLTHRSVFERMQVQLDLELCNQTMAHGIGITPYFQPFYDVLDGRHCYLPEDFAFIERAKRCGYRVYVDTSVRVGNLGRYPYMWEDIGAERKRFASYTLRQPKGAPSA